MRMQDEIAKIAYDFYLKDGQLEGHDLDNWLKAEKLVFTWYESEQEREKHVGAVVPDEHGIEATHDTTVS
jgi:Protein of unknown function (DUF2934)